MRVRLHVTVELKGGGLPKFVAVMGELMPILEGEGWWLHGAFCAATGRLNTCIDMWELEDFNHFDRALQVPIAHPRFPAIKQGLGR